MATLVYSDADGVDRSFSLGADPVMVGRAAECAIRSEDPRVSRIHARFFVEAGALWVEDLGSSNGIYVGPNKVQRAPVPTGEIVLVGSLMIRLLPASGTLPPPMGLHGTLAQWLEMERKARAAVEDERDAFAKRVGELHEEMRPLREAQGANAGDAAAVREELDGLRRSTAHEMEVVRLELAKAREAKMIAETSAGMTIAERLAESDMMISGLQHQLEQAKAAASAGAADTKADQVAAVTARADKAEKELAAAQIRAQGAERNLAGANTQAARAETKASELTEKLADITSQRTALEAELAAAKEKAVALETRVGAGDAPVQAAEARSAKLAAELADMASQFETRRDRLVELEQSAAAAAKTAAEAEAKVAAGQAELAQVQDRAKTDLATRDEKLAAMAARASDLESRLKNVGGAETEIAAARKDRDDARVLAGGAEKQIAAAVARAEQGEKRASAADTMAKSMAKDVAEALRRAVDADSRARGITRELDGAHRRAEAAEKRDSDRVVATREAEARATEAEAKLATVQRELGEQLEKLQRDLSEKADVAQRDLVEKFDKSQRELAAERSTAMSLVDRKTQLERELEEARTAQQRAEAAEAKVAEYEVQVESLEERIQDLESGIAVEQTASQSTVEDAREKTKKLEEQLAEAKAAAKTAVKTASGLEKRLETLEQQQAVIAEARKTVEAELAEARKRLAELEKTTEEHVGSSQADREKLDDADRRVGDAEARADALTAKAEAADLAIGRASALQRQLDEALQKLSYLERDPNNKRTVESESGKTVEAEARLAELEARTREAESHKEALEAMVRDAETRAHEAQIEATNAQNHAAQLEAYARDVDARTQEVEARAKDIETRAKEAAARIVDAERRARETSAELAKTQAELATSQTAVADAERRAHEAEAQPTQERGAVGGNERKLVERIAQLEREVDAADNVRQFAANTEREIAQLQRDLRELKAKLTQVTLERDRMESELHDVRDDSETKNRHAPAADPEATVQADLSRYTALVARSTELEQKMVRMERDDEKLRRQLAETEARLAAQRRAQEDEPTNTGSALPLEFTAQLAVLEEAIDSLRANMRAASDETAMMEQSESVIAVAGAVSAAAEHVERARDSVRALSSMVEKD